MGNKHSAPKGSKNSSSPRYHYAPKNKKQGSPSSKHAGSSGPSGSRSSSSSAFVQLSKDASAKKDDKDTKSTALAPVPRKSPDRGKDIIMQTHVAKLDHKNDSKDVIQRPNSEICSCDLIYKAAKECNKNEAKAIINQILSFAAIDVLHNTTNDTAISKLAAEGDIDTVNFLRKEFNASLLWVASGYARGRHVAEADKVLALAQTPTDRLALSKEMAYGYARGGHVAEADKVLALAQTPADRLALSEEMAYGYAIGGHAAEADKVLALAQTPANRFTLLQKMAYGYAIGGHVAEANKVLKQAQTQPRQFVLLQKMVAGYTRGGHGAEADKVFGQAQQDNRRALWKYMTHGYAVGGRAMEVLLEPQDDQLASLKELASSYARGGHVAEANKALKRAQKPADRFKLLKYMASKYAQSGHVAGANEVLALAQTPDDRLELSKMIVTHLNKIVFVNERAALQTLATFSPAFQKNIADELKDSKDAKVDVMGLVPKASKLNTVMTTKKLSFNQAMSWIQPEMQIWFLQGPQLTKEGKLAAAIILLVSTYLSPNTLTVQDTIDLSNRFALTTCRGRLFNSLSTHNQLLSYQLIVASSGNVTAENNFLDTKSPRK